MRDVRLGDDIDDFCVRCKRIMNHAVVSVIDGQAAKVRCRTCHSDHDYRHEQAPPPKVDLRKQALFTEVLKKVDPSAGEVALEPEEPLDGEALEPEAEAETDHEPDGEMAEAAEVEPAPAVTKGKAKAKGKGRARK
jgi:hypothetical protein